MLNLCPPAIIYLIFSITQILIDLFKGLYNTVFMKVIVATMVTLLLNILCERGLGVVSWVIVFIPFILMTAIVTVLLYAFGLDATTGKINNNCSNNTCGKDVKFDSAGNIIIYDPEYNQFLNPAYYQSPNIIVPNPHNNDIRKPRTISSTYNPVPNGSSSHAYQS